MLHESTKVNSPRVYGKQICKMSHETNTRTVCKCSCPVASPTRLSLLSLITGNKKKREVWTYTRFCRNALLSAIIPAIQLFVSLIHGCVDGNAAGPSSLSSLGGEADCIQLTLQHWSDSWFPPCDSNQGRQPSHFTSRQRRRWHMHC